MKTLKEKYMDFVMNPEEFKGKYAEFKREIYVNHTLEELKRLQYELQEEIQPFRRKLEDERFELVKELKEKYSEDLNLKIISLERKKEILLYRFGIVGNLIDNYQNYKYITIPKDIIVREYDIRTPKGNKARKMRTLKTGKILLCLEEFLSRGPVRHGMYYRLLDETDGYIYLIYTKDIDVSNE